jgi:putative tricarboxylic transport membrane protein
MPQSPSRYFHRALRAVRCIAVPSILLFGFGATQQGFAQQWHPTRPLELVVPSAAGGSADLVTRTLQNVVLQTEQTSVPLLVVNKPGGGGTMSLAYIDSHPGDARSVSLQSLPLITNRVTGSSTLGLADVTPLAQVVSEPIAFSVPAGSPIKTGRDLIARLRQDPASVTIAVSSSPGGQSHIAAALLLKSAGIDPARLKIVFFDSGSQALTALMGKHVTVSVTAADVVAGAAASGQVRIVATPAAARQGGELSGVPTWKEQGVDFEFSTWRILVGPKNMTAAQVAWWDALLAKAIASPQWNEAAKRNLWTVDYKNSAQTRTFLAAENVRLSALLGELGLAR